MKSNHSFSFSIEPKNSINNYSLKDMRRELPIMTEIKEIFSREIDNALVFMTNISKKGHIVKINFDIEVQNLGEENV